MALDDGEQVVEIVGDAASQLPDRFHFLRLPQLGLEILAFGFVPRLGTFQFPRALIQAALQKGQLGLELA